PLFRSNANQPTVAVDRTVTASITKSDADVQKPLPHGADRNLFGNHRSVRFPKAPGWRACPPLSFYGAGYGRPESVGQLFLLTRCSRAASKRGLDCGGDVIGEEEIRPGINPGPSGSCRQRGHPPKAPPRKRQDKE